MSVVSKARIFAAGSHPRFFMFHATRQYLYFTIHYMHIAMKHNYFRLIKLEYIIMLKMYTKLAISIVRSFNFHRLNHIWVWFFTISILHSSIWKDEDLILKIEENHQAVAIIAEVALLAKSVPRVLKEDKWSEGM